MNVGAQFYTLREFCQTLDGFSDALKRVADMGYRYVQVSGTCAYTPEWLREQLDRYGLECVLTHIPGPRILGETVQVAADHDVFGCRHVGLGWYGFDEDKPDMTYGYFMDNYVPAAKALREHGKYFMYHNHDQEFKRLNGQVVLEKLAQDVPAEVMGFTVDTFWAQAGGADPAQWIERLAGRIPCIHLKDYAYGRRMAVVGEGNINFDRVLEKAEKGGTQYLLVEQDDCNGENPFDCLYRSLKALHAMGLD